MANREETLRGLKHDNGRFFAKSGENSSTKPKDLSIEQRARRKVREMLSGGEITAGRAKAMLQKITTKFTPYNNENEYLCN